MAVGRLDPMMVLWGYSQGIFPMAGPDGRVGWYAPDPRATIPLDRFHVSRTLRQVCRQSRFEVRIDTAFEEVIRACADRPEGTWINQEIIEAYVRLHRWGHAHSVESWRNGVLEGGLYGVAIGGLFAGESMFHRARDASKVALVHLVERLRSQGFALLDVQFMTEHLRRFGAVEVPRREYERRLARAMQLECRFG